MNDAITGQYTNMQTQNMLESKETIIRIQELTSFINEDPFDRNKASLYQQRSQQFELMHENESAITDISKSLYFQPTCDAYVKRGKLFASSEMFYLAFMDFEEAQKMYQEDKKSKEEKFQVLDSNADSVETLQHKNISVETEEFLEKSTVIMNLGELKKITKEHERSKQFLPPEMNQQFGKIVNKLIDERINEALKEQNKNYEQLLELAKKQQQKIAQLEKDRETNSIDYERVFEKQMQESTLSAENKEKCSLYFSNLISQMQRIYLAAKVLFKFDQKISFEEYQVKSKEVADSKSKKEGFYHKISEKVFRIFQKHQDDIERVGEIVKELPYIGNVFKIVKSSIKVWKPLNQIKTESECENILLVRPSITSFNKLSARVAYTLFRHFKLNITTATKPGNNQPYYKKSHLEKLSSQFHKLKRNQLAARMITHIKPEQKQVAQDMGLTHASILMVGVAYDLLYFPKDVMLTENWENNVCEVVEQIQKVLINTVDDQFQDIGECDAGEKERARGCLIF